MVVSVLGLVLVVGGGVTSARSETGRTGPATAAPVLAPAEAPAHRPAPPAEPGPRAPATARASTHATRGVPQRIVVPALGIDHPVVGIDAPGGVLRPPDDPQVLGWWRSGARPGAKVGSALITGHTVSSGGGAFDDLETLRPGARVGIRTTKGLIRYRVTGVAIYRKAGLAKHAPRVFSQEVPGRLVLITCEDWNGTRYLSNAVVMADPVR
jgi:LPXTG-site transpeptidase (sortase) family protein